MILVAHGAMEKRDRFPAAVYQQAVQKVREAVKLHEKERRE